MKQFKTKSSKVVAFLLAIAMVATSLAYTPSSASAASKKVTSVKITKPSTKVLVLKKGKTYKMKVQVTAKKNSYKKVTYKTSKKKIATVSKSGKIKALKKGTAKITVTSKTDKKKKATLTVKVGTPITKVTLTGTKSEKEYYWEDVVNQDTASADYGKVTKVRKSKTITTKVFSKKKSATVNLIQSNTLTLKPSFSPSKATYKTVKYKSSNSKIASVNSNGIVLTKATGDVTITATAADGSGKSAKVKLSITEFKEASTPAPTAVVDTRKTTVVEDFESYEVGKVWDQWTSNGGENPGTMSVVADPLNPNNKVLKVDYHGTDAAYDFSPYFNVDLSKVPNAKAKLDNYVAVKFKVRVVSNIGDCQYKSIYGYFAPYGTINKNMANGCSYEADDDKVLAEPDRYKFLASNAGFIGVKEDVTGSVNGDLMQNNRNMPQFNDNYYGTDDNENVTIDDTKRTEGFAGYNADTKQIQTAEYSVKTLDFDRTSVNCKPYLNESKFDMTFGSTYAGKVAAEDMMEYYIDDIELVEGEVTTVPATSITLNETEKEIEVGEKLQLTPTLAPENTTDAVEYSSSDEKVATVAANGMITAIAVGKATITVKANDSVSATCEITVKEASAEEVITQKPKVADEAFSGAASSKDTEEGLSINFGAGNYVSTNIKFPAEITDFSKCKSVKISFKLDNFNTSSGDQAKMTFAVIHKDATSNYDESMDNNGRLYETYADVSYETTSQQDNITYDPDTKLYTATFSLIGQSNMDKAQCIMFARNGSKSAGSTVTITQIDYTMKAAGEADPTDAYPYVKVPFSFNYNDSEAVSTDTYFLPGEVGVEYSADQGVDGTGCAIVPDSEYNGPAVLLDNRKGTEDKDFYVEAMVKAFDEDSVDGQVQLYAGYSSYKGFAKGGTVFDKMFLKDDAFHKMHDKVTVPAGTFIELRIKASAKFYLDDVKIEDFTDQDITDDDYPEETPADHMPFGSSLSVDLTQTPSGEGFTKDAEYAEEGVKLTFTKQYGAARFLLPEVISPALTDSITVKLVADQNCCIKLYDASNTQVGKEAWNNTKERTIDLSAYAKDAKIAAIEIMSQESGETPVIITEISTTSTKMTVDTTQTPGGYFYTVADSDDVEGAKVLTYSQQYGEARYMFPQPVDAADIASINVELTSDKNIAFKLLDATGAPIDDNKLISYNNRTDKEWAITGATGKISGIALTATEKDETVTTLKAITVNASVMIAADMTQAPTGYGFKKVADYEGEGVKLAFEEQYKEARFDLPTPCVIGEFEALQVKVEADQECAIKLLDANNQTIGEPIYGVTANKTIVLSSFDQTAKIAKVAIMANAAGETTATVKSIVLLKNGFALD